MKNLKILILILFSISSFGFRAYASTVSLSPTVISITPGQIITVNVTVDPQGSAYTAKVALNFTSGLLSVSSFAQASGWLPLSQPGYDSVDNSAGSLIKTAGATGGFSAPKYFGTVTFVAQSSGTASISVSPNTQILNAYNQNTFTGGNQVSVSISALQPKPANPNPPRPLLESSTTTVTQATTTPESLPAQASRAFDIPWNTLIPICTFILGFFLGRVSKS